MAWIELPQSLLQIAIGFFRSTLFFILSRRGVFVSVWRRGIRKSTSGPDRQLWMADYANLNVFEFCISLVISLRTPCDMVIARCLSQCIVNELIKIILIAQGADSGVDRGVLNS